MMKASYYNYGELARCLVEKGASVEAINSRRETALYIASFRGNLDIVRYLVEECGAEINSQDVDGDTPLTVACYEEKSAVIEYLVEKGAWVNRQGIRGDTPIHIAVSNCSNQIVQMLIRRGADVDALNNERETPLHVAARRSRFEIIETLLRHSTQLDCVSSYQNTPFKNLLENLHVEKLRMAIALVKYGCDVNKSFIDEKGRNSSPLQLIFDMPLVRLEEPIKIEYVLRLMVSLISFTIQSGYRATMADLTAYANSWLSVCIEKLEPSAKSYLDDLLVKSISSPMRLEFLCRNRVRYLIKKPISRSFNSLNIAKNLKSFLFF